MDTQRLTVNKLKHEPIELPIGYALPLGAQKVIKKILPLHDKNAMVSIVVSNEPLAFAGFHNGEFKKLRRKWFDVKDKYADVPSITGKLTLLIETATYKFSLVEVKVMDIPQEQTISNADWDTFELKKMLNEHGLQWILENLIDIEYDAQVTEPHIAHAHLKRYTALVKIKRELYGVNDK